MLGGTFLVSIRERNYCMNVSLERMADMGGSYFPPSHTVQGRRGWFVPGGDLMKVTGMCGWVFFPRTKSYDEFSPILYPLPEDLSRRSLK